MSPSFPADKLHCTLYVRGEAVTISRGSNAKCFYCDNTGAFTATSVSAHWGLIIGGHIYTSLCHQHRKTNVQEYLKPVEIQPAPRVMTVEEVRKADKRAKYAVLAVSLGFIGMIVITHPATQDKFNSKADKPIPTEPSVSDQLATQKAWADKEHKQRLETEQETKSIEIEMKRKKQAQEKESQKEFQKLLREINKESEAQEKEFEKEIKSIQ